MYCKHCGKEIADDSKFCQYCGEQVNSTSGVSIEDYSASVIKELVRFDTEDVKEDDPETILDYKFPSATYASKKEYLEAHFDYFYTLFREDLDTKDIGEDELKKIIESATLEQLDIHMNEEPFDVLLTEDDHDIFEINIITDIDDRLHAYFDSKRNSN